MTDSLVQSKLEVKPQGRTFTKKCETCHGKGVVGDYFDDPVVCEVCKGSGKISLLPGRYS